MRPEPGTPNSAGLESNLRGEHERLLRLLNESPHDALVAARLLANDSPNWRQLRATILCDAGAVVADPDAVDEAIQIFTELLGDYPDHRGLPYNLANALAIRAQLDLPHDLDWYLRTSGSRTRARALNWQAASTLEDEDPLLASEALTNLGNALDAAHRWIEAYECYQGALRLYPSNGVASGNAARVLFRVGQRKVFGHEAHMVDVALRFAQHSKKHSDVVLALAGPEAVAAYQDLPSSDDQSRPRNRKPRTEFERFVTEHRLFLAPILEGAGHHQKRWDDAHIQSLIEPVGSGAETPPLFAMFNVLKADYLVARALLYQGVHGHSEDTGLYMDTLDYATYGQHSSRLVLAQRATLDLLDKVAVALNEYFQLGYPVRKTYFNTIWREKRGSASWHPKLRDAIDAGNPALIALSEIAADLSGNAGEGEPRLLSAEREARNTGTHRFTVLHDLGVGRHRPSEAIEHHELHTFRKTALRTLQLARAALLHFLEVIFHDTDARSREEGPIAPMHVQPHHLIRGEEE
jgi:tetratricopeptide (TPR) repeat protein